MKMFFDKIRNNIFFDMRFFVPIEAVFLFVAITKNPFNFVAKIISSVYFLIIVATGLLYAASEYQKSKNIVVKIILYIILVAAFVFACFATYKFYF